ncbi:DUF4303 domain-containing protein [Pectobacterium parmentieri]|uniref:DUF4303 domain-containing protein n=1 Tax=Pectobacterium parmentieri TaxID=1905730 RepID=A0A8B3FXT3_PECPM|nr:DUF4303 domain-containing protein [Pectobacterium parmentieri]AOR58281.1 hypothetical protein A8F97_05090 [Pectobacterium parmentieri]AYH10707.1 DUF4303 domain-containing protein [Pectobacterium parmentieri]AYH18582.1 DUF4303 domain-containing protein [Pectobacterium parmentieri]AYH36988.1 DUF4303 domain-containing protein [Pectobacterium parmentieri]AZS57220.1 DUF4303 domain-containing protein [Pectobacterium parmentieri]
MDWYRFEGDCYQLAVKLITRILSENPDENFYAFSLYTDSSAMTVSLSANSKEKLKAILDADSDKSKENQSYYKWAISEWAYEGYGTDFFSDMSKELRLSPEREHFYDFKNSLIYSLTNALKRANEEIVQEGHTIAVMFVSVTDDDSAEDIENMSSKIINNRVAHNLFLERYGND